MPTTLNFDLASKSACAPLLCGENDHVVIQLKPSFAAKSHDGSGYLVAPITALVRTVGLSWRYTVVVPDSQLAEGQTLNQSDVWPKLGCITMVDSCLFAKIMANLVQGNNWQTVSLAVPVTNNAAVNFYMFRRATAFRLNAMEIGMEAPSGPVTIQLQATTAGGTVYSDFGSPVTITPPAKSARRVFSSPITVPASAAVRARITTTTGIYSSGQTVDVHLFTTEP